MSRSIYINAVETGHVQVFSDFEDNGPMWTGEGERSISNTITYNSPFQEKPIVSLQISLMDAQSGVPMRYSLKVKKETNKSFQIVFSTWLDSRFARVAVNWTAMGMKHGPEYWSDL